MSFQESFKQLLKELLKSAKIKDGTVDSILNSKKYMDLFERAFTHPSFEPDVEKNYETLETLGDLVMNMAIVNWTLKNKNITNPDWLSKTKHKLIGERQLASFAEKHGFYKFIKLSPMFRKNIDIQLVNFMEIPELFESFGEKLSKDDKNPIVQIVDYRKVLEDTFEAFCGALQMVVNDRSGLVAGPGYAVCYEFISSLLEKLDFEWTLEEVSPPVTTLKEKIYDPQGWKFGEKNAMLIKEQDYFTKYDPEKNIKYFKVTFIIPGFPKDADGNQMIPLVPYNPKLYVYGNKRGYLLETGYGTDKKQAKANAAKKSLESIKRVYGI